MRLEPRETIPPALLVGLPILGLVIAILFCALLVMLAGASPLAVFGLMLKGALGSQFAVLETLTRATPLIFTGLAAAVAFRARLWNIGGESQLYAGALMTAVLGTGLLPLPSPVLIPLLAVTAMIAGAAILMVSTGLKTQFGVDEVVTTLLLNFVMLLFVSMMLEGPLKDPSGLGWPQSRRVIEDAALMKLVPGKRLHLGFVMAIAAALAVWFIQRRTTLGFEMRAVGENVRAARFAGIPVSWVLAKTALLSGGLAGLGGYAEVAGLRGNLTLDLSPGFGATGIVVAMLAMLHPLGVVAAAILVAAVFVGADAMSRSAGVPSYIAHVMVASALLSVLTALMFVNYRMRWR